MSDRERMRRIQRLRKVSEVRRDAAQAALARAQAQEAAAQGMVQVAEARMQDGAERVARLEETIAADFIDAYAYMRSLRHDVESAREDAEAAAVRTSERRDDATGAHREVRKMEIWSESTAERARLEEARLDQKQSDELAARLTTGRTE